MFLGRLLAGKRQEVYPGILLGLDYSGKTTLLYHLKLGHDVQTIPTIGFNLETIKGPGRTEFELWDIGGCDQMRRFVREYIKQNTFVLYVYDCADSTRLDEAIADLQPNMQKMRDVGSRHLWILLNKQDALPPNERERIVADAREQFEKTAAAYADCISATVIDSPGLSAKTGNQLEEMMDRIQQALTASRVDTASETAPAPPKPEVEASISQEELLSRVHRANAAAAEDAATFWKAFTTGQLKTWDHYNHLRAGYFVLLEGLACGKEVAACSESFIEHLERLRNLDPQRFRNTTHRTMTFFWIVQLLWCTKTYQAGKKMHDLPEPGEFGDVLVQSPSLMNSHLWKQFYPKELMFSPEAKQSWCPPTLRPLPSIVQQDPPPKPMTPTGNVQDESDRLLEFGFVIARTIIQTGQRRGAVVKEALQTLQKSTMELRTRGPTVAPYSETQAYFWIQTAHVGLQSMADNSEKDLSTMTLSEFRQKSGVSENEWRRYYSTKLWESIPARMSFVLPDLMPLPNILPAPDIKEKDR